MERLEESAWGLLERELFLTVPLLHDRLIKPFEGLLRQGFSPMQFYTLVLLRRKTSMAMTELAANFHIPKQQMTRIVNRLAELELVQRTGDPGDRRRICVCLTQRGQDALEHCRSLLGEHLRSWMDTLAPAEQQELTQSAQTLRRLLSKLPASLNT